MTMLNSESVPDIEVISFEELVVELTGLSYNEFNKRYEEDVKDDKARDLAGYSRGYF